MAGKRSRVRRDDWNPSGTEDGPSGPAIRWVCTLNGDTALIKPGVHPMDATEDQIIEAVIGSEAGSSPAAGGAPPAAPVTATDRIAAMFAGARGQAGARVRLQRILGDGSFGWCADYTPDEWEQGDLPMVRKLFGAGRYQFTLHEAGTGRVRETATIEVLPLGEAAPLDAAGAAFAKIMERLDRLETARGQLPAPAPAPDPAAHFAQFMDMARTFRDVFAQPAAPAPAAPPVDAVAQVSQLVSLVSAARELGRQINEGPEREPSDPLLAMGPKLLDVIGKSMEAGRQPPQLIAPHVALPPSIAAAGAPPAPSNGHLRPAKVPEPYAAPAPQSEPEGAEVNNALQQGLAMLNGMARLGIPPEQGADFVYEAVDNEALELLQRPDWFEYLVGQHSEVAVFRSWYEEVRAGVLKLIEDEKREAASETHAR